MQNAGMSNYDIIVIGAGAAGLMCAGEVAATGQRVLVFDHAVKIGSGLIN